MTPGSSAPGDQVRPLYRTISLFRDGTEFLHWPPLTLVHLLAFVLVVATISNAQGFRPNAGQFDAARNQPFDSSVLFTLQDERFYQTSVDVAAGLTIQFVNANLAAVVTGESLLGYPVNIYYGPPSYWRENVPQFSTIHYAQIYSGIDLEWHTAPDAKLRILVAPGANLNQIVMRCNRPIAASPSEVSAIGYTVFPTDPSSSFFFSLGAYQGSRASVSTQFVQIDAYSFGLKAEAYDSSLALMIEIGDLSGPDDDFGGVDTSVRDDGGQLSYSQPTGFYNDVVLVPGALRSTRPDGTITLLSEFGGVAPTFLSEDAKGNIALAGTPPPFPPAPPVAAAAPETSPSTGWFAQFDSHGKLLASTYTDYNGVVGGPIAVGPDSSVYFATANSIVKWVPGSPKFAFTAPVQNVTALAVNSTAVAFALSLSPGQPTTPGVTEATYQGPWDLYIGELNAISGDLQLATYVPITGASQDSKTIITKVAANLALARSGELWIASEINFSNGGKGHTLTAMSADGSRVLDSESIPLFASLAFDHAGNLAFVGFTNVPNLPTTPDAAQRVVCNAFGTTRTYLYLAKRAPDNSVPYATYVPGVSDLGGEKVLSFNGRFVIGEGPVLDSAPTMAGIGCFIDTASRLAVNSQNYFSYNIAATGELLTIVGHGLGPLEEFDAPLDGNGKLPTQLGGVQVLADGIPLPLLSVQQGLVTFYVEPGTVRHSNLGETTLQVQWPSDPVPRREKPRATSESLLTNGTPGFSVFSSDGTGTGQAAALNQDGTVNSSSSPAAPGSIVAIFGNGEGAPSSVTIANLAAEIISFGPAPGLPPGVHQLNVRVPQVAPAGPAPLNVSTTYISIK